MLEISPEIPFVSGSKIRFLVWDRSPQALETWNWSQGLYCFLQSRTLTIGKEFRFGSPLWGIPNHVQHIEYPFYFSNDFDSVSSVALAWKQNLSGKNITVLVSSEEEETARLEFAKILLSSSQEESWETIAKRFGLIGEKYQTLNEFHKTMKRVAPEKHSLFFNPPPILICGSSVPNQSVKNESSPSISVQEKKNPISVVSETKPSEVVSSQAVVIEEKPARKSEAEEIEANASMVENAFVVPEPEVSKVETPASKEEPSSAVKEEAKVIPPSTTSKQEAHSESLPLNSGNVQTKFSLQLKMMGVISLLFVLSVSTIIFFASYYFKQTAELQLRANNLRLAEIVGLKVKSDVLSSVEKGRQIAITLTSQGLPEDQRKMLLKTFFKNDREFIYMGIFEKQGNELRMKKEVFNEEELKQSSVTEEDFHNVVLRNKEALSEAFNGQSVLLNSSPGFQEPSFAIAIPTSENGELDNVLVMVIKLSKIIGAFQDRGIETTFMVNGQGVVIAHPKEDLILAATNLSSMPIVRSMVTNPTNNGQSSYFDQELNAQYLGSFQKIGFADTGVITLVSEDKAFEDVYKSQRTNLYIMGIGLCSALIFVFFFSKTITKPVLQLLTATLEIAKGNFRVPIKPTTKDEVGLLTRYFIDMGHGLEEREKVKNILGSMIDPVVVQEAMVDLAALKRGSETMITAFFSDVASFSTISEQLKSADLAALLNEYLSAMTLILKQHEGVLDKYIGDAIVGIFNAPVSVQDHQLKAARASVDMVQKLEELRKYWTRHNLYSKEAQGMDARIGLNAGPAKVGFMGTDALASYTMMGDTVNLAARLEAAGKDYGVNILITDAICNEVGAEMLTRYVDLVRVKGKNEPVKIHELVGYRSQISSQVAESAQLYEAGFSSYLNQDWDKAVSLFQQAEAAKGKKDKASHVIIERCLEYKLSPPGSDWDGVFTRTHK
ncbi:adenylate/guanylate cyclase domain-containing protein [Leptospira idonii]|uniref:HAMP domain-containing protein n=1 Tax=Leptospira idonii TaxID=1193500 RepID=A0A4R9LY97_9LEPT|nr:adenylate/guanylate cyclase domain-containing protein [Leptospira idonii]TGN18682.1 HAMP domain-containing protein [Leptospira idonii]